METDPLIEAEIGTDGRPRQCGIYEEVPDSDEWWIRYHDADSRSRREKAGTHGMAVKLYQKRKMEALRGKKLPETLRKAEMLPLRGFSQRFADEISVRCKEKPNTVMFYAIKLKRPVEYDAPANALLDKIDKSLIAACIRWRSTQSSRAGHNRKEARGSQGREADQSRQRQPGTGHAPPVASDGARVESCQPSSSNQAAPRRAQPGICDVSRPSPLPGNSS